MIGRNRKKRAFLTGVSLAVLAGLFSAQAAFVQKVKIKSNPRILFIGNSYTKPIPQVFKKLASSGRKKVKVESITPGGWTFEKHVQSEKTLNAIQKEKWDYVVLQEQSQIPSFPEKQRAEQMYPSARLLHKKIKEAGAKTVFYMTWGREKGDKQNHADDTYESMQDRLRKGYEKIAKELSAMLAPVGMAWKEARKENPGIDLWREDGSHPNDMGVYLTACVFYAAIFQKSPVGLKYTGNLSKKEALFFQKVAAKVVIRDPGTGC